MFLAAIYPLSERSAVNLTGKVGSVLPPPCPSCAVRCGAVCVCDSTSYVISI